MSEVRMGWTGLQEMKDALRAMPAELTSEAADLIYGLGMETRAAMFAAYPEDSGRLRAGLIVAPLEGNTQFGAGVRISNLAADASIWEIGSRGQVRHTKTGASRGIMKPGNVFRPAMAAARRALYPQLFALLERAGLEASGEDAIV
jgi:hypothetical protein